MISVRTFLADRSGAVSMDVVVLTAMLVGTTLAVVNTFSDGLESMTIVGPHVQVREQTDSHTSQGGTRIAGALCTDGIAGLQEREDARATLLAEAPLDVDDYMQATYSDKSGSEIRVELATAREAAGTGDEWTVADTLLGAVECELALRGLD